MNSERSFGVVIRKPVWNRDEQDWRRDREGNALDFPFARTIEDGVPKDYSLFRDEFRTPGLERLQDGQVVSFEPEGRVARDVERVPVRESRRWIDTADNIETRDGNGDFNVAKVTYFNWERGFGFAALRVNPENKVFFHARSVIRRDPTDIVGFFEGQKIYVRLAGPARNGQSAPAAQEVICLEE